MKLIKNIVYFIFKILDLIFPDEIILKVLNRFKNKLFGHFTVYKTNLELAKRGSNYWKSQSAIYYFIYAKNLDLKNTNTEKILNKLSNEIKFFDINTSYLEIGCGYPIYLKSKFLREKIKNYYGYDINPYISEFFNISNIYNSYPDDNNYDVLLFLSGVIKYFSEEQLKNLLMLISRLNLKKIIISHKLDYEILKSEIDKLNSQTKINKIENIQITLI